MEPTTVDASCSLRATLNHHCRGVFALPLGISQQGPLERCSPSYCLLGLLAGRRRGEQGDGMGDVRPAPFQPLDQSEGRSVGLPLCSARS